MSLSGPGCRWLPVLLPRYDDAHDSASLQAEGNDAKFTCVCCSGKLSPWPLPLYLLPYTSRLLISFHLLRPMAILPQNPKKPLEAVSPLPDAAEGSARTWLCSS